MNEISDLMSWLKKSMRFPLSFSLFCPQPPLLLPILRKSWTKKLWQSWKINCKRTHSGKCLDFVIIIGHFDNSMGSLSKTSCTPQNSCYLIWQRNNLINNSNKNNCNHHLVSQSKWDWMVFFLRPSHVIFFHLFLLQEERKPSLWIMTTDRVKREKKWNVVNRDLEIILWKSANDAANGAVLQLGNRNANSCSGGKFLALIGASVTMPERHRQN